MGEILGIITIRDRGEITIPHKAREYMKIKPGDKISLQWEDGEIIIKKVKITYEKFNQHGGE